VYGRVSAALRAQCVCVCGVRVRSHDGHIELTWRLICVIADVVRAKVEAIATVDFDDLESMWAAETAAAEAAKPGPSRRSSTQIYVSW
jgi:hypothetical protein